MVRIRLRRMGKRHQPSYRVVVADSESPRNGRFIENIGFYNPRNEPPTIEIDAERARYWLSVGAQPSDPAARLLGRIWKINLQLGMFVSLVMALFLKKSRRRKSRRRKS